MARAFLFDLDGTLVDSERENAASIAAVLGPLGRQLSDEEMGFVVGHGWREIYQKLAAGGGTAGLSFDELKERASEAKERICAGTGLSVLPGAVEFVQRAAKQGRCAVVSGSSRREIAWVIGQLGLGEELPFFVGAEDVSRGKPAPDGYLAASKHLKVPPRACTVFEDSSAGIAAAKAAGMTCIALAAGNFLGQDQSDADLRVQSFLSLGDRLWDDEQAVK
jgi:HAD superfamily hydrolase (TIGR01509 family)